MTGGRRESIGAIVLDIEGTTTPIAFVYDVLFPYARKRLRAYLTNPEHQRALREPLRRLRAEKSADAHAGLSGVQESGDGAASTGRGSTSGGPAVQRGASEEADSDVELMAAYVEQLMDRDRKSPGLKLLQGQIWEEGYRSGELCGEVFADVPPAVRRWRADGLTLAIYSSGSELAQRLLFGSTSAGDLTPYFARFFDTAVGAKQHPDSYRRIALELNLSPSRLLFVSDVVAELDAAQEAGFAVLLCRRPGNHPQPSHGHSTIANFDEIRIMEPPPSG